MCADDGRIDHLQSRVAHSASNDSEADIKQWDIAVLRDGTNLPPGGGTPAQGARIYAEKCVACHAEGGKGGGAPGAGPSAASL
jgi:cytochrome c